MPTREIPAVQPRAAWTVRVSQANLRLLKACVNWLQQVQDDPEIQAELASLRLQLERARPVGVGRAGHQARGGRS